MSLSSVDQEYVILNIDVDVAENLLSVSTFSEFEQECAKEIPRYFL